MILNFYSIISNTYVCIFYFSWLIFHYLSKTVYVNFGDSFSRVLLNDFFINNYYYFWTSFWYIPTLLIFLLTLFHKQLLFLRCKISLGLLLTLFILLYELLEYWNLNTTYTHILINPDNINLLLTNSINKYHPFLFYLALISIPLTFMTFWQLLYFYSSVYFSNSHILKYSYILTSISTFIIIITLFLGSWWALQEGSWGGWWNWDPSEVFGLVVMLIVLSSLHTKYLSLSLWQSYLKWVVLVLFTFTVYLFIQLNFNLVSHNFGIKVTDFVNTTQSLVLMFIATLYLITSSFVYVGTFCSSIITQYSVSKWLKSSRLSFFYWSILLVITAQFIFSFYPLINDFVWRVFSVNTLNWFLTFDTLVILFLVYAILPIWRILITQLTPLFLTFLFTNWLLSLSVFIGSSVRWLHKLHTLVVIFITISVLGYYSVETLWFASYVNLSTNLDTLISFTNNNLFSLSNNYLYYTPSMLLNNEPLLNPTTFFLTSTSPESNNFSLISYGSNAYQALTNGIFFTNFFINVFDNSLVRLTDCFLLCILGYHLFFKKKILIIF